MSHALPHAGSASPHRWLVWWRGFGRLLPAANRSLSGLSVGIYAGEEAKSCLVFSEICLSGLGGACRGIAPEARCGAAASVQPTDTLFIPSKCLESWHVKLPEAPRGERAQGRSRNLSWLESTFSWLSGFCCLDFPHYNNNKGGNSTSPLPTVCFPDCLLVYLYSSKSVVSDRTTTNRPVCVKL